nr:Major facilitator superfamily MFS-1 domain containing protein [Haemonchus contortus]
MIRKVVSQPQIEMKKEGRRYSSARDRLRNDDFIAFWLTSNQQPGYVPAANQAPRAVHFKSQDSIADSSDTSSTDSSLTEKPKYLNGGYGWIVVGFSFVLHFIADGLSFSFGVLFPKIQERFGAKRFGASSVASLFLSLPLLLGPIAGFITDVCDCKRTILIGGIFCCAGAVTSYFCQSILMFTLCFGGLIGVGLSLVYNAAIVIVTYNFELRRGVATALAVSGTGVGTIVFPVFLKHFVPETGTDIGPAIIAISLVLSIIIFIGLIVRDVEWQSDTPEYKMKVFHRRLKKLREDEESMKNQECGRMYQDVEPRRACSLPSMPSYFRPFMNKLDFNVEEVKDAVTTLQDHPTRSRSVGTFMNRQQTVDLPPVPEFSLLGGQLKHLEHLNLHLDNSPCTTVHCKSKNRLPNKTALSMDAINNIEHDSEHPLIKMTLGNETSSEEPLENDDSESDSEMSNDGDSSSSDLSDTCLNKNKAINNVNINGNTNGPVLNGLPKLEFATTEPLLPMSARLLRTSLAPGMTGNRIPAGNAVARYRGPSNLIAYQGKIPSAPTLAVRKKRKNLLTKLHLKEVVRWLREEIVLYRLLVSESSFVLFLMSVTSLYFVLDVPYVFFYDFAVDNLHIEETSAAWLTSIIGVANLLSTWICGVISDADCVKSRLFTVYGIAMCGLTACMWIVTMVSDTLGMALICACFGFFISSNYVLQSVMLTTMWEDMRNFQSSYALTSFCEGIATLFGPPLIGYVRDRTGSYKSVFIVSGFLCLSSAILSFVVQVILNKRNGKTRLL